MRAILQAAFILHTHPLNETSLLLDVLTRPFGRISLLAKGARRTRSRYKGLLRPFTPLVISWSGKTELMSLNAAEAAGTPLTLAGNALFSGIYLNELLVRLLPRLDPYPSVFDAYHHTLTTIQTHQLRESSLRLFERDLLIELGYGFCLSHETANGKKIIADRPYAFIPGYGLHQCTPNERTDTVFSGKCLLALHHGLLQDTEDLRAARSINRLAITSLLGGRPLKSRAFFSPLAPVSIPPNPLQK